MGIRQFKSNLIELQQSDRRNEGTLTTRQVLPVSDLRNNTSVCTRIWDWIVSHRDLLIHLTENNAVSFQLSLETLPTELIHQIFDTLDMCTICTSLYNVSSRLNSVIETYKECDFNFKSISKHHYYRICSIIHPEQVISLTLSDANDSARQVQLFLEEHKIESFTRLRSLNLNGIDNDEEIIQILLSISASLSSLTIENSYESYSSVFFDILMSIVTRKALRTVNLNINDDHMSILSSLWPSQSSIQKLKLASSCSITFFRTILHSCPNLVTFQCEHIDFDNEYEANEDGSDENNDSDLRDISPLPTSIRLTSLFITSSRNTMETLEWLISQLPSLKRLKIITKLYVKNEPVLNGYRWEQILVPIEKFEFVFSIYLERDSWNKERCLSTFETPFWVHKQWKVAFQDHITFVMLYSLPYCDSLYVYQTVNFYKSSINSTHLDRAMTNVRRLIINVASFDRINRMVEQSHHFPNASQLELIGAWRTELRTHAITFVICPLKIVNLIIYSCIQTFIFKSFISQLLNLKSLTISTTLLHNLDATSFQYEKCLHSLNITQFNSTDQPFVNAQHFCTVFPRTKRLYAPVANLEDCQYIIDQCRTDLISSSFQIVSYNSDLNEEQNSMDLWARNVMKCSQYRVRGNQIDLWLQ